MHAAVLEQYGTPPRHRDFDDPAPQPGAVVVDVAAAALHHLDLHKATGTFYMGPPPLPSVVGTDGVGRLADGRRVYFDVPVSPFGSMAERALADAGSLIELEDGIDDATAAAIGNTGLGAWLALSRRADLEPGETVLVLGATGALGSIAVQAAKVLGAGRVVAAARASDRLTALLGRGADAIVELDRVDDLAAAIRDAAEGEVDVTIDTLWGEPAAAALTAAARRCRHVQVGHVAALDITIPATALRSVSLDVRGFSVAHPPAEVKREGYLALARHVAAGDISVDLEDVPLRDVAAAWERQRAGTGGVKLVLSP